MASPEQFIEISDFSLGIHSDMHAVTTTAGSPTIKGAIPGNGAARVDGTARCRADRTGALIPLPKRIDGLIHSGPMPATGSSNQDPAREGKYLLDAEVGPSTSANEQQIYIDSISPSGGNREPAVFTLWGFYWSPTANSRYMAYVLGSEYRPWEAGTSTRRWDFLFGRSKMPLNASGGTEGLAAGQGEEAPLPPGSLTQSRYYYGASVWGERVANGNSDFRLDWWFPTVVAAVGTPWARWPQFNVWNHATAPVTAELDLLNDNPRSTALWEGWFVFASASSRFYSAAYDAAWDLRPLPTLAHDNSIWDMYIFFDMTCASWSPGTPEVIVSQTSASPNFGWKLTRRTLGDIRFEYSTDGTTWTTLFTVSIVGPTDGTRMKMGIGINQKNAEGTPQYEVWAQHPNLTLSDESVSPNPTFLRRVLQGPTAASTIALDPRGGSIRIGADEAGNYLNADVYACSVSKNLPNTPYARENPGWLSTYRSANGEELSGRQFLDWGFDQRVLNKLFSIDATDPMMGGRELVRNGGITRSTTNGTTTAAADPFSRFSPGIGAYNNDFINSHVAGSIIGMNLNPQWVGDLPAPRNPAEWAFHYNDEGIRGDDINWRAGVMNNPYMVVSHQGRILVLDHRLSNPVAGRTPSVITTHLPELHRTIDDFVWFSDFGLPLQDMFVEPVVMQTPGLVKKPQYPMNGAYPTNTQTRYNGLNVLEDIVTDIGTVGVVSSDQVLLVKHRGGGALVSGDIESPTVRRLPYLEPTHGVITKGAQTPIGYVYGSRNGVYAWEGGEVATKLSAQIDGYFFDHTNGNVAEWYGGQSGRFAFWNRLICVPNNYLYDIDTRSWWRLEGPTDRPFNIYNDSDTDQLFAFPYKHTANTQPLWYQYDPDVLDTQYSWQSHPLVETRGRTFSFQNVVLVATSFGGSVATITVTLTGFDLTGNLVTTAPVTFTLADKTEPQLLRKDITPNFLAEYVHVKIVANSNDTEPAPKIHSLKLGVAERGTIKRHG